jgi:hypothetical protein
MLNKILNAQVSDTIEADSSNAAGTLFNNAS